VLELLEYFGPPQEGQRVQAVPGQGLNVPVWILGSSLFGAQVAAALGLPFAFASHFAPAMLLQAFDIYRSRFKPSQYLDKPYTMAGFNIFAADTDEEAKLLATSMQQSFVSLRSGMPRQLPPPVPGYYESLHPHDRAILDDVLACSAIGSPETVRRELKAFAELCGADEIIVASMIYDHAARLRSYQIAAEVNAS
jgi:luciferase family oxidoreductase group 1